MKNLAENNLIRFTNITKKKDGHLRQFQSQRASTASSSSASISVDISALNSILAILSKKSSKSAPASASKSSKRPNFSSKDLHIDLISYLGVAQLG